jgi:hypothetical protein
MVNKIFKMAFCILLVALFYVAIDFLFSKWGIYGNLNGETIRAVIDATVACMLLFFTQRIFKKKG